MRDLHDNTPVKKGENIAATRLIPLIAPRRLIEEAEAILNSTSPVVEVLPLRQVQIGLVITGNEIFYGRIEDRFEAVLKQKAAGVGEKSSPFGERLTTGQLLPRRLPPVLLPAPNWW